MQINVTSVLVALIGALYAIFVAYAIPWIRAKAGLAKWEQLHEYAAVAVMAAEQMYGFLDGAGKLQKAIDGVNKALSAHGISFDADTVRAEIEAAVLALKRGMLDG